MTSGADPGPGLTRRHFEAGGADYARHRPSYPPTLAAALADLCPARDLAVDVGCGTGQLSVMLADQFAGVIGIDPSASQIASATPAPGVTYRVGAAEDTGLADASADLVVAAQAAHWFYLPAFYTEARRVLRPGGVLALVTYGVPEMPDSVAAAFDQFYWQDIHDHWPPDRRHVEQNYASLEFPFPRLPAPPLAIQRDWTLGDMAGYVETWSAATRARDVGRGDLVDAGIAAMTAVWGEPDTPHRIVWPITCLIARPD